MADKKVKVKPKPPAKKNSQAKASVAGRKRRNKKGKTTAFSGTVQFKNAVARSLTATSEDKVTVDPFEEDLVSQFVRRTDTCNFQITAKQIVKMSDHTKDLLNVDSDIPFRLCWRPPMQYTVQEGGENKSYADVRGQFVSISKAVVRITNVAPVQVKLRGNTPKAVMDQPFDVSLRSHEFSKSVGPNSTATHVVTWSNNKRDSPHYTPATSTMVKDATTIIDAYGLMPDIDPEANEKWDPSTTVFDIHVTVHYEVESSSPNGVTMIKEDPFTMLTLGNYYNMFHVDNEVSGLFSGASRRQLITDGKYMVGPALFEKGFQLMNNNIASGIYYILYQADQLVYSPVVIPGAPKGAVACLPVSQLGMCVKTPQDNMLNSFNLVFNLGNVSCKVNGKVVSGTQMWILASTDGFPIQVFQVQGKVPNAVLTSDPEMYLGNNLTVDYWPSIGNNGVTEEAKLLLHMKNMQKVGISLMAVIAVFEAASAIVNIIKATVRAIQKG